MKNRNSNKRENPYIRKAVDSYGGTVELAQKLGTSPSRISEWLYETRAVPVKYAVKLEKLTIGEIKAKKLRPDIFED